MAQTSLFRIVLTLLCLIGCYISGSASKTLRGLRYAKVNGTSARFSVDRKLLENELQYRKDQDPLCDNAVKLELPEYLPNTSYDRSHYGEIMVLYLKYTDHNLREELPCHLKDQIATSFPILIINIPVLIDGEHGFMPILTLTNSEKIVLYYQSSYKNVRKIDSIDETKDGKVTLRHGDDVMMFQTGGYDLECHNNNIGTDFDLVTGKVLKATVYPQEFNWGCDLLGDDVSYCQVLREHHCELQRLGGDVCVLTYTSTSERCPSFMRIERLTGFFRDFAFLLTEPTPIESFEAEWLNRDHEMGIQFPCLSH